MNNDSPPQSDVTKADAEAVLLQHCPRCGYCIRGLPIHRKCPECGFEVDRRWEVFGGRSIPKSRWRYVALALFVIGMVEFMLLSRQDRLAVAPTLIILGLIAIRALWTTRKSFIAIGPAGLFVYQRRKDQRYEWRTMGRAQFSVAEASIVFGSAGATVRIPTKSFFGMAMTEVDRCVRAINARRASQDISSAHAAPQNEVAS